MPVIGWLDLLRAQIGAHRDVDERRADPLARFVLALLDGAFIARQADPSLDLADLTRHMPTALLAINASFDVR